MIARLAALVLVSIPLAALAADPQPQPQAQVLDLSAVTAVRITGEAGSVALTTIEGDAPQARLGARRVGWFATWMSSWFYGDCRSESRMAIEGATLTVEMRPGSWLEPSDCRVELTANLRRGAAVTVEQRASQVRLDGEFSAFSLDAKAADVTLDGHAASVSLSGEAMRSHLTFDRTEGNETIAMKARSLDTYLGFAPGTAISYGVKAGAALVDSALPDTPGSRPSIAITGDYVRATIR